MQWFSDQFDYAQNTLQILKLDSKKKNFTNLRLFGNIIRKNTIEFFHMLTKITNFCDVNGSDM